MPQQTTPKGVALVTRELLALMLLALGACGLVYCAASACAARFTTSSVLRAATGLLALGLTSLLVLVATYLHPAAGQVVSIVLAVTSVVVLAASRFWKEWRSTLRYSVLTAGLLLATLSFGLLWAVGQDPFGDAAYRFYSWPLPPDNRIPALLADWLEGRRSEKILLGDWLPSDRPPLQTGLVLYVGDLAQLVAPSARPIDVQFIASVVAQLAWVPAALAILSSVGFDRWASANAVVFAASAPVVFVNIVFSWPKILAGSMVIAAIAVLIAALRGHAAPAFGLPLAAGLSVLGLLGHGGTTFVLPVVLVLAVLLLARSGPRSGLRMAAISAAVVAVMYTPWLLFQRFVAPPGNRLLKWHLAGVMGIDDRGFVAALADQYRGLGWAAFLDTRLSNLSRAFDFRLLQNLDYWSPGWTSRRAEAEFYETPIALGVGAALALIVLIAWAVQRTKGSADEPTTWSALLILAMFACIAVWSMVMFIPGSAIVHQGSHAWMLILLLIPAAWVVRARWWIGPLLILAQLAYSLVVYSASPLNSTQIHGSAVVTGLIGVVLVAAALLETRRMAVVHSSSAATPD